MSEKFVKQLSFEISINGEDFYCDMSFSHDQSIDQAMDHVKDEILQQIDDRKNEND